MITIFAMLLFYVIAVETSGHIVRGSLLTEKDNEDIDEILYHTTCINGNMIHSKEGWFSYHPLVCPWAPINVTMETGISIGRIPIWHSRYKKLKRIFKTKKLN